MKEKCPFYAEGKCKNPNHCLFENYHYQKKQCIKGGLLKTPKKLKYLEE